VSVFYVVTVLRGFLINPEISRQPEIPEKTIFKILIFVNIIIPDKGKSYYSEAVVDSCPGEVTTSGKKRCLRTGSGIR
jgi:hypothetical protein